MNQCVGGWAIVAAALLSSAVSMAAANGESGGSFGDKVLFCSSRIGSARLGLYAMNPDGSGRAQLEAGAEGDDGAARLLDPVLSADGRRIAFVMMSGGMKGDIYAMDVDGGHRDRLTRMDTLAACPAWSPDGRRIAFNTIQAAGGRPRVELWLMDADGAHPRRLGYGLLPSWSPDGQQILYTVIDQPGPPQLRSIDPGGDHSRLVASGAAMGAWSPDGQWIAFMLAGERGDMHIATMRPDGTDRHQLAAEPGMSDWSPLWSSDGTHIYFVRTMAHHAAARIYVMDADGQHSQALSPEGTRDYLRGGTVFIIKGQLNESLNNLKQIGAALYEYAAKHDGAFPPLHSPQIRAGELGPLLESVEVLNEPDSETPYAWNPLVSGQAPDNFTHAAEFVVAYEAEPAAGQPRNVLFLDGHVAPVSPAEWTRLKAISKIR